MPAAMERGDGDGRRGSEKGKERNWVTGWKGDGEIWEWFRVRRREDGTRGLKRNKKEKVRK